MLSINKVEVVSSKQLERVIMGMRNPYDSWDISDSTWHDSDCFGFMELYGDEQYSIGPKDKDLMLRLIKAGPTHAKFRRMIPVWMDISAPLYWWKEFDTYKVGTVSNSCSTMHTIAKREFTLDDFSYEHLETNEALLTDNHMPERNVGYFVTPVAHLQTTIELLNQYRELYLRTGDKKYWWQLIQLLPSSYQQTRTIHTNYEVLAQIYSQRKDHKLDEWRTFCNEIVDILPYNFLITGEDEEDEED